MNDINALIIQLINAYTAIEKADAEDEDEMDMVLSNFSLIAFELAERYRDDYLKMRETNHVR